METIKIEMKPKGLKMEADREQVALALKTYRLRAGKSQKALAEEFGMSRYTIIRAEKGKPITWEMAYRIFAKLSERLATETT